MIARMPELSLKASVGEIEAEQAVDFLLVEDAVGALGVLGLAVVDHRRPLAGDVVVSLDGVPGRFRPLGGELLVRHRLRIGFALGCRLRRRLPSPSSASPHSAASAS